MDLRVILKRRWTIALPAAVMLLAGTLLVASLSGLATAPATESAKKAAGSATGGDTHLQSVLERGELVMLTRHGASSYFVDGGGPNGPEYALARQFAEKLGVDLKVIVADDYAGLASKLQEGRGDMIAANLSRTPARQAQFRFALPYDATHTLLVVRKGLRRPESLAELEGLRGAVLADSSYAEILQQARADGLEIEWEAVRGLGVEDLLHAVAEGDYEYTLIDERVYRLHQRYYPGVREAITLDDEQPLAWAFRRGDDDSLVQAANLHLRHARENGTLAAIHRQYFQPAERLGQLDMMHFQDRMRDRLPHFLPFFQEAADRHDLDWRLLAAMGYQESHWDPLAASPTGVRGVMMLTLNTAKSLGVDDRLDPLQSIRGGAEYFLRMRDRLPERIAEPDRSWLALASYNIGMGHLEDARRLTARQGGNPDLWRDVRLRLPMLTQEKYHRNTRFGYARGYQAQSYVDNIQRFYETLIWMDTRAHPLLTQQMITAP